MNNRLVWFTGAPGSKWSSTSVILQSIKSLKFNTSDRLDDRTFSYKSDYRSNFYATHMGAYFGPGNGMGENFSNLEDIDPEEVEKEITKQWKDSTTGRLLVKSHHFTHSLEHIAKTWKNNSIVMITRPTDFCIRGWYYAGGWDIKYPNYRVFYQDDNTLKKYIKEHNYKILEFCENHKVEIKKFTEKYLYETFNWSIDSILDLRHRKIIAQYFQHIEKLNDVHIAIYNIDQLKTFHG
jgi:hypothetical protein